MAKQRARSGKRTQRGKQKPARTKTGWDPVAQWYVGWTGKAGSKHHRKLAIPAVLELLPLRPGMRVLEVGCAHGVLAPAVVEKGGVYTGVDISAKLIGFARKIHGAYGNFHVADACALSTCAGLRPCAFDAVVFMLSVQDMDPLAQVLRSAAWALKADGSVVILMVHPCFRVPRQSGWGWDAQRKLQYRRVDRYLSAMPVPMHAYPGPQEGATISFHRPLHAYVNGLADVNLLLESMQEIPSYKADAPRGQSKAQLAAHREFPLFLGLRARKVAG